MAKVGYVPGFLRTDSFTPDEELTVLSEEGSFVIIPQEVDELDDVIYKIVHSPRVINHLKNEFQRNKRRITCKLEAGILTKVAIDYRGVRSLGYLNEQIQRVPRWKFWRWDERTKLMDKAQDIARKIYIDATINSYQPRGLETEQIMEEQGSERDGYDQGLYDHLS